MYALNGRTHTSTMAALREGVRDALGVLQVPLKMALRQPLSLLLLAAGTAIAAAMLLVPELDPWVGRAPLVFGLGLAAYAATVIVFTLCAPEVHAPEVRQVQAVRREIARRLPEVQQTRPGMAGSLVDAVRFLDHEVLPVLRQIVVRRQGLVAYLARYDSGAGSASGGPQPAPDLLARMRATYDRQCLAVRDCVQQAVDAEAALVAMLAVGDDRDLPKRAREWAEDLSTMYEVLEQALLGEALPVAVAEQRSEGSLQAVQGAPATGADDPKPAAGMPEGARSAVGHPPEPKALTARGNAEKEWEKAVEDALNALNNPASLAKCRLIKFIPCLLEATRDSWGAGRLRAATPLDQAEALRKVLLDTIQKLKPAADQGEGASRSADQYRVIREHYVMGKPVAQIYMRLGISDRTFYRRQDEAIEAIARDLAHQEEMFCANEKAS